MKIPNYEIYALKYAGPFARPKAMVTWFTDLDQIALVDYYVFVIRGGEQTIIVDCGCSPQLAKKRNLIHYVNPTEVLKRIGVDARKVENVVVTHIHFDHVSGINLFPRANVFVQESEFNFWIKNPMAQRAPFLLVTDPMANRYLAKLQGTERLRLIRGDRQIFPGIELLRAPGHTIGHQVVAVQTAKGKAIIGSDAAHMFSSYRTDIPSALITDMIAWMKSYDKIRQKASSIDLIFPGHDPGMMQNYPKVAEDVTRLV